VPEKTKNWFRWFYPFTPQIWRDASHAIAVSEYTRQLALKHYPVDIQVIPNGVDLNRLDPGEIKVGNPPQIIFAGRFVPQKNPLQVVKILADLQDLPWNCVMLGDGVLRKEVEREVRKHNLQERIILTGWLTPDKVIQWFAKSDLLYMPSISEGLPVVGVQGLAMGLAIVASPVGGFVELVSDGENGYLIQPDQPDKTKESLRGLLSDPSLLHEYRINSRQKSVRYDLNKIVNSYNQLFTELASGYTKTG
jgi:glycosyltransferase involved in cell wall biosynthesis